MSRGRVKQARELEDRLICRYHTAFSKSTDEEFQWICDEFDMCPSETLRMLVMAVLDMPMSEFETMKEKVKGWKN